MTGALWLITTRGLQKELLKTVETWGKGGQNARLTQMGGLCMPNTWPPEVPHETPTELTEFAERIARDDRCEKAFAALASRDYS